MEAAANLPTTIDLTPRRHHGYLVLIFIIGTLFPPLGKTSLAAQRFKFVKLLQAVAARFGIGKDFWINLLLTVCGYIPGTTLIYFILNWLSHPHIPGHGHNFYIQVCISYFSLFRISFLNSS